jgi:hypothetical protein
MRATAEKITKDLEPQTLDRYAGAYGFSIMGGFTLEITRAEDKLYVISRPVHKT